MTGVTTNRGNSARYYILTIMYITIMCCVRFDYTEAVDSASSISTPPVHDEPFASENLGDTVVKVKVDVFFRGQRKLFY